MRILLAAAAALLAMAPAAHAQTRWNMAPAQVVSAVPGATLLPQDPDEVMRNLDKLATATIMEGDIELSAGYHFTQGSPKLQLVNLRATDNKRCPEYRALLRGRHGDGVEKIIPTKIGNYDVDEIDVAWTDKANGDQLLFVGFYMPGSKTDFALCKLLRTPS